MVVVEVILMILIFLLQLNHHQIVTLFRQLFLIQLLNQLLFKMEVFLFALYMKMYVLEKRKIVFLNNYVILQQIQMFLVQYKTYVGMMERKRGSQDKDILCQIVVINGLQMLN